MESLLRHSKSMMKKIREILNSCNLLTIKPVIFAANVNEDELAGEDNDYVKAVREYAADVDAKVFVVCAQIEQEISELDDDEKKEFLEDLDRRIWS
mgnify:CR=1 FL=1